MTTTNSHCEDAKQYSLRLKCWNILNPLRSPRYGSSRGGSSGNRKFGNPGDRLRKKKWDLSVLPKFEKDFYKEHLDVQRMSQVSLYSKHAQQNYNVNTICLFVQH